MNLLIPDRRPLVNWILVCSLLIFIWASSGMDRLFSQNELDFNFEFLGDDCGISNRSINGFQQDKYGFLWIGTGDGLNRFDGKSFKIFRNIEGDSTSLIDDFNQFLAIDPKGDLWVSYRGKGISKFDNNCQCFINNYNIAKEYPDLFNYGFSILRIEADSTLWIGGNSNGLNLLNLKTQKIKHWDLPDLEKRFSGIEKQATNSIYQIYTKDGNLYWLITGAGLYTFDKRTEKFEHWSQDLIDPSKNRHDFLVKMELEGDHGFWLASNGGRLFYFDLMTRNFLLPGSGDCKSKGDRLCHLFYSKKKRK
ncbi:MAG: hypothetical protein IPM92_16785 [Saprospiraceae bacterium]|nr:hypothetical protein [Saprospiraceae bacterium]